MIYIILAVLLFGIENAWKTWVEHNLHEGELHLFFKGRVGLQKTYNKGAALGTLSEYPKALLGITIGALTAFVGSAGKILRSNHVFEKIGVSLVLGGGFSNAWDRIHKKQVTDYIRFPKAKGTLGTIVFNFSDFFLIVGGIFIILTQLFKKK